MLPSSPFIRVTATPERGVDGTLSASVTGCYYFILAGDDGAIQKMFCYVVIWDKEGSSLVTDCVHARGP